MPVIIQVRVIGQDEKVPIRQREEVGDVIDFDDYPQRGWGTEARTADHYRLFLFPNLIREDVDFLSLHDATMWSEAPNNARSRKLALDLSKIPLSKDRSNPITTWDATVDDLKACVIVKPAFTDKQIIGASDRIIG